jgi:AAA domain/Bifunctional DNA primase/polymerase, N-terminal
MGDPITPSEFRSRAACNGFVPIPLNGKIPVMDGWQKRTETTLDEIKLWERTAPAARNTGFLTRWAPTLDIDIRDPDAAEAAERLVSERFEEHGIILVRQGRHPKRAIPFRTAKPFPKITVTFATADPKLGEKLELLCDGQQLAADGDHPDTGQPYRWFGGSPADTALADLPAITEAEARALVADLTTMLVEEFDYRTKPAKSKSNGNGAREHDATSTADWSLDPAALIDHDRLVSLAARLVKAGMNPAAVRNLLRQNVEDLIGVDEERRQRRLKEIPDIVSSAAEKIEQDSAPGAGATPADTPLIWYGDAPQPAPSFLIEDTLPEIGVAILGGQWGTAKTFIGADLAAAVIAGGVFAGKPVRRRGGVLWLAAEGETEIERRICAAIAARGGDADGRQPFTRQNGPVPCLTDKNALAKLKSLAAQAAAHLEKNFDCLLALIVIDTMSAAAGFDDENSAAETQKTMNILAALARETKTLVVPIDHYGKISETGVRGSSAKSAAADAILAALGDRDQATGFFNNRKIAVVKLRGGPTGRVIPFELRPTPAGDTCVVNWEPGEPEPETPRKHWSKSLTTFKRALDEAIRESGKATSPIAGMPEVRAVDQEFVRSEFYRIYIPDSAEKGDTKAKNAAFHRCAKEAANRGLMCSRNVGPDLGQTLFWIPLLHNTGASGGF